MTTTRTIIGVDVTEAARLLSAAVKEAGGKITSDASSNPIRFSIERPKKGWTENVTAYRGAVRLTPDKTQTCVEVAVSLPWKTMAALTIGVLACFALAHMGFSWNEWSARGAIYVAFLPFTLWHIYRVTGPWAKETVDAVLSHLPPVSVVPGVPSGSPSETTNLTARDLAA